MASRLKQKLLSGMGFDHRHPSPGFSRQNTAVDGEDSWRQALLAQESSSDEARSFNLRRRFLYRLAVALHSYGSSASRTEYLIERAAERLDFKIGIAVFPTLILLSFRDEDDDSS